MNKKILAAVISSLLVGGVGFAQEDMPADTGLASSAYHTAPRYRASEEHPLRLLAYVFNPIGWVVREGITRPISAFAASTETTRSVMGFREPNDWRQPECFSADDTVPDCRSLMPFNYDDTSRSNSDTASMAGVGDKFVYFPDVNFDFNKASLNELGQGRIHQIARLLEKEPTMTVMLEGHADYKGTDAFNQKLAMTRAETVRKALTDLGVDGARLSTMSFGETSPTLSEETDWARAVNRRVGVRQSVN